MIEIAHLPSIFKEHVWEQTAELIAVDLNGHRE